jgi:hypothetical protein
MGASHHLTKDFEEKKRRKKMQTKGKGIQK